MRMEGDNDAVARVDGIVIVIVIVDGNDDVDIERVETIDFEGRIALGVKIDFDEKTGRDEIVGVVKNEAGSWVAGVSNVAWTGVVMMLVVREILVVVGA